MRARYTFFVFCFILFYYYLKNNKKSTTLFYYLSQSFMPLIYIDFKPGPGGRIIFLMMKFKKINNFNFLFMAVIYAAHLY